MRGWIKWLLVRLSLSPSQSEVPTTPLYQREQRYKHVRIPLHQGLGDPPPGYWKPCAPSVVHRFKAELTCPFGHGMTLKGHSVASNGLVSPSVVCHHRECGFHEYVVLADWNQGKVR